MPYDKQPAQQTALGNQGFGMLPGTTSPDVGLVLRSSLLAQPKNSARILKNLRWSGTAWTTEQTGYTHVRAGSFNSGAAFKGFGIHNLADGTSKLVMQVGARVYEYDPTVTPLPTESLLFTAVSESIPCMRSYSPSFFLYTNGVDNPQKWNGTTWSAVPGFPVTISGTVYQKPRLVETYLNRAVYARFNGQPFALLISEFGDPEGFTTGPAAADAALFNVPSRYGEITSVRSFRITQTSNEEVLLIGTTKGLLLLSGTGADNFQLVPITSRFGIVSNNVWLQIDDSIFVLGTDGIRQLNANTTFTTLISAAITYPIQPLLLRINSGAMQSAFVIDNPDLLECYWYFSVGSDSRNRRCIYMNYGDMLQGLMRLAQREFPSESDDPLSWLSPACGVTFGGNFYTGSSSGYLREEWSGNKWNLAGIDWSYGSPLFDPPTPSQESSARGFWILCEGGSQSFTANAYAWPATAGGTNADNVSRVLVGTTTFTSDMSGTTILGSWRLGITGYSEFGREQWQLFPFYPPGAGHGFEVELSGNTGNGDFSFLGIFSTLIAGGTRQ